MNREIVVLIMGALPLLLGFLVTTTAAELFELVRAICVFESVICAHVVWRFYK